MLTRLIAWLVPEKRLDEALLRYLGADAVRADERLHRG